MVDIVQHVTVDSGDEDTTRGRTLPIWGDEYAWWTTAVRAALKASGSNQKQLSADLKVLESAVSRCINRQKAVYELVIAISDELVVPYPVIFPTSEAEALHLATQRRLFRRDAQVEQIAAGLAKGTEMSQTPTVVSEHAIRSQGTGKGSAREQRSPRRRRRLAG